MMLLKRRKFVNHKKRIMYFSLFFLLLFISIGYAYLNASLSINGNTTIAANTWDIHFENLNISNGSVVATTPAAIQSNSTSINYSVLLSLPGDYYEFSVDVVNAGTIPGKVSLAGVQGITSGAEDFLDVTIKYDYGDDVQVNDLLNPGTRKRVIVRLEYKDDLNNMPINDINLDLTYTLNYTQTSEEDGTIENLLENLAADNTCITKYNGNITPSIGSFNYRSATKVYFDKCSDKRNVIFGGFCWQVVRSTDFGGLKMVYNGQPVNGQCNSNRSNHLGIVGMISDTVDLSVDNYLYGTGFTYDNNSFTLTDISTYGAGKYTCVNLTGTCTTLYYVQTIISDTEAAVYGFNLDNVNYATIGQVSYNYNSLRYSPPVSVGYKLDSFYAIELPSLSGSIKFGTEFNYENGNYVLSGTMNTIGSNYSSLVNDSNLRYTCWNSSGTCEELSYVYEIDGTTAYYERLILGQNLDSSIGIMVASDAINQTDSIVKMTIDNWFKKNMLGYANRLEKAIYCNDRTYEIVNNGFVNFGIYEPIGSLACPSEMDQFMYNEHVYSGNSGLTHSVGMITASEWYNLGSNSLRNIGLPYWTMTPVGTKNMNAYVGYIATTGDLVNNMNDMVYTVDSLLGVRPAITLLASDVLVSGDGSENSPWIIE